MEENIRAVWAEIDLDCIKHNMIEIRKQVGEKIIIAIVKADAYGHGAIDVASVLLENGADKLGVAVITEALELRKSGIEAPILILGYTPLDFTKDLIDQNIEQTVYSLDYAIGLSEIALEEGKQIDIHIAIDTGMGRLGFLPNEESLDDIEKINNLKNINIKGIFTHFSSADETDKEYTMMQLNKFKQFNKSLEERGIKIKEKHLSNSAAILDMEEAYFDAVRPGIIIYGYYPSNEVIKEKINLKPALTLKSNIVHVKVLPKGEYISYGREFKTERESIIATLPIGYADGYTRALYKKGKIIINGKSAPIVGRICMDQCMIDITDVGPVKVGDEVILIGEDQGIKFNADDIAKLLNTINYEVLCLIGKRIPRVYKKNKTTIKTRNYL
ncbi:alanine racemase [Clostridium gasigenes]|uniref:Alanine racemase n=1 Tax=Clostridium gasigenes TaxID=94869 RepID=A0A1H0QQV5_9CLOT|nr:alanine racemase [Clostridium gasigenes]MBU3089096.1 alanine racemase [Clostridium gasigenes]SDP19724.1 alanine racemase [Clostridium gasigenes]